MDPATLGSFEWGEIGAFLLNLWIVVLLIVVFAANMLLGHNVIPSLAASQHVPNSVQKVRPLFYVAAVLAFSLAVFMFVQVVDKASVLQIIWDTHWI